MMVRACNLSISVSEFHTQKKESYMNNDSCCTTVVKDAGSSLWKGTLRSARSRCSTDAIYFLDSDTRFLVWASEPASPPPPPLPPLHQSPIPFGGSQAWFWGSLSRAGFTANIPPPAGAACRGVTFDKLHLVWRHCSV